MSPLEKRAYPLIFTVAVISYVMSIVMSNEDFAQHWMIREDGMLESITALALLSASLLCGYRCWTLRHCRPKSFVLCTAAAAAVMFFGMGEEISWGQRIFNVESPEFFRANNVQYETNLHNLEIGGVRINKLIFGKVLAVVMVTYLLLPLWYQRSRAARQFLNRLAVPVPRLHQILAILAVVLLVETSGASKRGEINEFALSTTFLLILLNPRNLWIFRPGLPPSSNEADLQTLPFTPAQVAAGDASASGSRRRTA